MARLVSLACVVCVMLSVMGSGCDKKDGSGSGSAVSNEMLVPVESSKEMLWKTDFEEGDAAVTAFAENSVNEERGCKNIDISSSIVKGPVEGWDWEHTDSRDALTGQQLLKISGTILPTDADKHVSASMIVCDTGAEGLKVKKDTYLQYYIYPSMSNGEAYDYCFNQMYFSVDLLFDDGSYLSDLGATDQNLDLINPQAQGDGRALVTNQWNIIYGNIGSVAAGKKVEKVLIAYDNMNANASECNKFETYFNDISLYNCEYAKYEHLTDYVNTLRGSNDSGGFSRGLCAPFVTVPHGFTFFAPATVFNNSKLYDFAGNRFYYMTTSHEPSYWIGDRGTWQFMVNTSLPADCTKESIDLNVLVTRFSHDNEMAKPYCYSVEFDGEKGGASANSKMETTATSHCAVMRFTYGNTNGNGENNAASTGEAQYKNIIFDCVRAPGGMKMNEDGTFEAYSDHCDNGQPRMYVYGKVSEQPKQYVERDDVGGMLVFEDSTSEVELTIATSYISIEQAKKNMELEVGEKNFDAVCEQAQSVWEDKLSIVTDVKGATYEQLVTLYSGLYRLYAYPNEMSENTGTAEEPRWQYMSPYQQKVVDGKIYINNGFWDTYRTSWPAYELFTPNEAGEMLDGLVQHYVDSGDVPRWSAPAAVNCMVGTNSDVIFGDAALKGISFDKERAYESALKNATAVSEDVTVGRKGMEVSVFKGYAPGEGELFSWSMETCVNDYGIAQLAKVLANEVSNGAPDEASNSVPNETKKVRYEAEREYFLNRAKNYTKLFVPSSSGVENMWFCGHDEYGNPNSCNYTDGKFDPFFWGNDYTETNAYGMCVSAPFDMNGTAQLYGGLAALEQKLDTVFTTNGAYNGYGASQGEGGIHEQREQREVKLGQYEHNNQPSHHQIYMYNYAGNPAKTQKYVRDILDRCYVGATFGQGYNGDEDNGEASAWFIFSAMGLYPANVGSAEYTIGSPLFREMTVKVGDESLVIKAPKNSQENIYIQGVELNGQEHTKNYFTHDELKNGAVIEFKMDSQPSSWGCSEGDRPTSITDGNGVVPAKTENDFCTILEDFKEVESITTEGTKGNTFLANVASSRYVIDDLSTSSVRLDEKRVNQFGLSLAWMQPLSQFTLTCDRTTNANIKGVKLFAANAGGEWAELASYGQVDFKWDRQTIPFAVPADKRTAYTQYKIEIEGSGRLAEIEFIGEIRDYE